MVGLPLAAAQGAGVSIRAFSRIECPVHGSVAAHYCRCVSCYPVADRPVSVLDTPKEMARARKERQRARDRMARVRENRAAARMVGRPHTTALSAGELRCVELLAECAREPLIVKTLSTRLNCRPCTVSNWLNRACKKLGLKSKAELIEWQRKASEARGSLACV